ncbi:MAG: adenosylcobinamide-phosphate synthase CbiB [Muribaculum sp.]
MDELVVIMPLLIGYCMDLSLGDPSWLPHPVVGFGHMISACERHLNRGAHRVAKGAFTALGLVLSVYMAACAGLWLIAPVRWLAVAVEALCIFYCLAGTTLVGEVREVFRAVDRSVDEGRCQVARIVGRDTSSLSPQEVRIAALETLAENLSDGVIAPLFWYLVLGVPGMLAYKMVNTLDSMIGYRTARYREFGRFAARMDDVANYIPARITAVMMVVCAARPGLLTFVRRYGCAHASPNSGYPEAAMAGILGCRFGGAHDYFGERVEKPYIGTCDRQVDINDMTRAVRVCRLTEALAVVTVLIIKVIVLIMYQKYYFI